MAAAPFIAIAVTTPRSDEIGEHGPAADLDDVAAHGAGDGLLLPGRRAMSLMSARRSRPA
jgi:hypothetical protein